VKELLKAALSFQGTAVLDIISPCVTFNNRGESTKSYAWGKAHEYPLHDVTWVPKRDEIQVEYQPGEFTEVDMHDGSSLLFKKLEQDYNPTDRMEALKMLEETCCGGVLVTGLIFINEEEPPLPEIEEMVDTPLVHLAEGDLRPSEDSLEKVMEAFR
jgi:2-oxoglutarate ferredoxin oxidoreductase subunit beta